MKISEDSGANSENPDEITNHAAFHQGLHFLLKRNRSSEKEMQYFGEINENSIGPKRVKVLDSCKEYRVQ